MPGLAIIRGEAATGARKGQGVTKALVGCAQNNGHVVPGLSGKVISKISEAKGAEFLTITVQGSTGTQVALVGRVEDDRRLAVCVP